MREWKPCRLCGGTAQHRHHVFFGTANRKLSEKYGCVEMLCSTCHAEVHAGSWKDQFLKKAHQKIFEDKYGRDAFMRTFGRNYLYQEEEI